jgi:hypothetical protein
MHTFMHVAQTYAPKNTQKFGFEFSIFWVFGFWVWVWLFCKSLANSELDNTKWKKKFCFWVSILIFFLISKIDTQIHTQKQFFIFHFQLSNSKFARDLQNNQTQTQKLKKLKTQTQTKTFEYSWAHMFDVARQIKPFHFEIYRVSTIKLHTFNVNKIWWP